MSVKQKWVFKISKLQATDRNDLTDAQKIRGHANLINDMRTSHKSGDDLTRADPKAKPTDLRDEWRKSKQAPTLGNPKNKNPHDECAKDRKNIIYTFKQDVQPMYDTIVYVGGHITRETPDNVNKTYIYINPCFTATDVANNAQIFSQMRKQHNIVLFQKPL